MEEFRRLQQAKQEQAAASLREIIDGIRVRNRQLDPAELEALIEQARSEFYHPIAHG